MQSDSTLFILGTGAGVGKTLIATGVIAALEARGLTAVGLRPIETGCSYDGEHDLVGHDGARLRAATSVELPPLVSSPYRFAAAVSPAMAADQAGLELTLSDLEQTVTTAATFGRVVVEGPGGPLSPLTTDGSTIDLAARLASRVLLVARDQVGGDGDVLLALEACARRNVTPCGVILSRRNADHTGWSNEASIRSRSAVPVFVSLPPLGDGATGQVSAHLENVGAIDALLA